ncbi:MAG: DNA polymerase III subunit delta' [Oceanicaulis sp.]
MSDVEIPEPDREGDLVHPRHVYDLFGHDAAEAAMARALDSGRMHHAWMITGPKGVGKATLAWRLARRALGAKPAGEGLSTSPDDPACRRLEAMSHPDFLLIRRPFNDKTRKLKAEITVEEARRAPDFFSRSASGGHWRVCLVDAADDLNMNAANALLKTLEEPPRKGLLLLVVNTPGRLLPTIRSRCRRLSLRAPGEAETARWLTQTHQIKDADAARAAALAAGAPGRALALAHAGAAALKDDIDKALGELPSLDRAAAARLAANAAKKDGDAFKQLLMDFLIAYAHARARTLALGEGGPQADAPWVGAADGLSRLARESDTLYLDPKQTVYAALGLLQDAAA